MPENKFAYPRKIGLFFSKIKQAPPSLRIIFTYQGKILPGWSLALQGTGIGFATLTFLN
jgi:hypothetical protein